MLRYVLGDLFEAINYESPMAKFIVHIVNDSYRMGSGFVVPLNKKWPETRSLYMSDPNLKLGNTQFIQVMDNVWVCNMIAQHGTVSADNPKPIKYAALANCMRTIAEVCHRHIEPEIVGPLFGSNLAGGNWDFIEELIQEIWSNIDVTIYKLNQNPE